MGYGWFVARGRKVEDQALSTVLTLVLPAIGVGVSVYFGRDPESVQGLVDGTVERFGRLDVLVNNAAGNFVCPAE